MAIIIVQLFPFAFFSLQVLGDVDKNSDRVDLELSSVIAL